MYAKKQIIANIFGGLGNQLFIYWAARSLQIETAGELLINRDFLRLDRTYRRSFQLNNFCLSSLTYSQGHPVLNRMRWLIRSRVDRFLPKEKRVICYENPDRSYRDLINENKGGKKVLLHGYWQSEKYFKKIRDVIRREVVPSRQLSRESIGIHEELTKGAISLGVHIRTYSEIPGGQKGAHACGLDYYRQGIKKVLGERPVDQILLFSDDLPTARALSSEFNQSRVVSHTHQMGDSGAIEDLYLLSKCSHFVISCSSFSWWGTWLAETRDGKLVYRPAHTMLNKDFYPPEWRTL